jgi:hypothetical protein
MQGTVSDFLPRCQRGRKTEIEAEENYLSVPTHLPASTNHQNMAGPTASVILPNRLDELTLQRVTRLIDEIADSACGMDFAVRGRPFLWATGEDYEGQFTELGYSREIGWTPQDQVMLIAMCNQQEDHVILGSLHQCFREHRWPDRLRRPAAIGWHAASWNPSRGEL